MKCKCCGRSFRGGYRNHCGFNCLLRHSRGPSEDEYRPFRVFLSRAKSRGKRIEITLDDLYRQWEKQDGVCPYTGWKMLLPGRGVPKCPQKASLDRIDSSQGYVLGNIQFVSLAAQYAKHEWNGRELDEFFAAVASKISL